MEVRIYDNLGKTLDRYTVIYMDFRELAHNTFSALGMSTNPYHGYGQHCTAIPGRHLGKRIKFNDLPKECKELVWEDLKEYYMKEPLCPS